MNPRRRATNLPPPRGAGLCPNEAEMWGICSSPLKDHAENSTREVLSRASTENVMHSLCLHRTSRHQRCSNRDADLTHATGPVKRGDGFTTSSHTLLPNNGGHSRKWEGPMPALSRFHCFRKKTYNSHCHSCLLKNDNQTPVW